MDKYTKGCIEYLKKLLELAEEGIITISIVNTDIHVDAETHKDLDRRTTCFEWRVNKKK